MSMKPVHMRGRYEGRERLWEIMVKMKRFTVRDLVMETSGYDPASVRHYANSLVAAGYLRSEKSGERYKPVVYELIKMAPEAPRVRRDGSPVTQGIGREQMWRSMRIAKTFTVVDLVAASSTEEHRVSPEEAKYYLRYLEKAGYVRKDGQGVYVLINYTGPKPPQIQRIHQVWDPNTRKVTWPRKK